VSKNRMPKKKRKVGREGKSRKDKKSREQQIQDSATLLYYPVQRGYAQGDSQEYSKGFDKRLKIDKTQNSR
jgi:hypothetical protein